MSKFCKSDVVERAGLGTLLAAAMVVACGGNGAPAATGGEPMPPAAAPSGPSGAGPSSGASGGGTVTIGDDTWVVVASRECVVRSDLVNVRGHVDGDSSMEVLIESSPANMQVGDWVALGIGFEISGSTVSGRSGLFGNSVAGGTAMGEFDVTC